MKPEYNKTLYGLTITIVVFGAIAAGLGLFFTSAGQPFDFTNQYGDLVKINGQGIYARDSFFMAPIFRGTDCAMLILGIPLLVTALLWDIKAQMIRSRMALLSMLALFVYYSASLAFGVTYNQIFLLYLCLFSGSFFALIVAFSSLNMQSVAASIQDGLPYTWIYIFLILVGFALFGAWLPDIIQSLVNHRSLALIEIYTTQPTYILDMGIISPVALISLFALRRRSGLGYVLLEMLLVVCLIIGIILPIQSVFQIQAGIEIPLPILISKIATFCVLAIMAIPLEWKLANSIRA